MRLDARGARGAGRRWYPQGLERRCSQPRVRVPLAFRHAVALVSTRSQKARSRGTVPAAGEQQVPLIDIPSGNDNSVGVYAEDRFTFNEGKTSLFGGARADYNDWRERRVVVLQRPHDHGHPGPRHTLVQVGLPQAVSDER
jgi:hypothetical protein